MVLLLILRRTRGRTRGLKIKNRDTRFFQAFPDSSESLGSDKYSLPKPDFQTGDRLYHFRKAWEKITTDEWTQSSSVEKTVIEHCCRTGMCLQAYLDDWLQPSRSQVISLYHREQLLRTILVLGFVPNCDKSELIPSKMFSFL